MQRSCFLFSVFRSCRFQLSRRAASFLFVFRSCRFPLLCREAVSSSLFSEVAGFNCYAEKLFPPLCFQKLQVSIVMQRSCFLFFVFRSCRFQLSCREADKKSTITMTLPEAIEDDVVV